MRERQLKYFALPSERADKQAGPLHLRGAVRLEVREVEWLDGVKTGLLSVCVLQGRGGQPACSPQLR
jgi:hypothetical protein